MFEAAGARLLLSREPGASMFASTRAWRVSEDAAAELPELPAEGELAAAGWVPLAGIDTFWYNWAAVNRDTSILR